MGKYSGLGMGPAFRVYWPSVPSRRVTKAEADRQRKLEEEAAAAARKVQRLAKLNPRLAKLVREARANGKHWLEIVETLADAIREAERREAALQAGKK